MPKQTLSADKAREALLRGVDAVANPVKVTLGPRGRNVLLDRPGQTYSTRDGVTVAKECSSLPDPFENMGALAAREVADAAVVEAGDGTTTATVLLQAIVQRGMKLVSDGAEPLRLADDIKRAAADCETRIKTMSITATPELVKEAAIISTHGDVELGTLIAETACKVGATGVIELQESRDEKTSVEYLEGFYFERGWRGVNGAGQGFLTDHQKQRCVLNNPFVLISERVIAGSGISPDGRELTGDGLFKILQHVIKARRPLLIIADDLIGDAYNLFLANILNGGLAGIGGCFVKLPGFGESRAAALEDLRIAIGAARIHSLASTRIDDQLSSFVLADLGACKQAIITPTRTVLIEGNAHPAKLNTRVKHLIDQSQESTNPLEKETLDHRIARLVGGVAVLRVGAETEVALNDKKALAEDAVHACKGALLEGVVPGGGVALLRAAKYQKEDTLNDDAWHNVPGVDLLLDAIQEPMRQIARNAGVANAEAIVEAVWKQAGSAMGFDARAGSFANMYERGIVDPTLVVLTALRKAASVGAMLLTTEVLVTDIPAPVPHAPRFDVRM